MDSGEVPESSGNSKRHDVEGDIPANCSNSQKVRENSSNSASVFTSVQQHSGSISAEHVGLIEPILTQEGSQGECCSSESYGDERNACGDGSVLSINNTSNCVSNEGSSSKVDLPLYDNGLENAQEHQVCSENSYCSVPSTSGRVRGDNVLESRGIRESRKRPSSLKLNRPNLGEEDSSSDTGNDDYSLGSEDGCIYTYRGGEHLADLPSSFFSLDMGLPLDRRLPFPPNYVQQQAASNPREQGSRASSPDMDFLEMDFDPGPSCDVDTEDESTPDADLELDPSHIPEENEELPREPPEFVPIPANPQPVSVAASNVPQNDPDILYSMPSTSQGFCLESSVSEAGSNHSYGAYITHVNMKGEQLLVRRTMRHTSLNFPSVGHHLSSGDLVPPKGIYHTYEKQADENQPEIQPLVYQINQGERPPFDQPNLAAALYHHNMSKELMELTVESESLDTNNCEGAASTSTFSNCPVEVPRCMVWSEREACERQVTQIGTSACGATAVVNVFTALGVPVNLENINSAVGTRQRANDAPIARYLLSRSVAGCTAAHLVSGINKSSGGLVTARFFPTYPERAISLSHWLADWISLGAVPILTLNLQVGCDNKPDAWHHQMVFGVSPRGIYLCNPLERVRETTLWPKLTSPSVLLVKSRDVLSRFTPTTDLSPLMYVPDRRFHTFNVLGQVANVLREWRASGWLGSGRTQYIRLPAAYTGGVTLAALTGSEAHRRLMLAPQLPILGAHHCRQLSERCADCNF